MQILEAQVQGSWITDVQEKYLHDKKILGWYPSKKRRMVDGEMIEQIEETFTSKWNYTKALTSRSIPRDVNGNFVPFTPYTEEELKEMAKLAKVGKAKPRVTTLESGKVQEDKIKNLEEENKVKEAELAEKSKRLEQLEAQLKKLQEVKEVKANPKTVEKNSKDTSAKE